VERPVAEVQAKMHTVVHAQSNRTLGFGALAAAAALPVPDAKQLRLKPRADFRFIGKECRSGMARTSSRSRRVRHRRRAPRMKYAVIARPRCSPAR